MNVNNRIAAVLSSELRLATKIELETVYGVEDLYDFLEIMAVDAHNRGVARRKREA